MHDLPPLLAELSAHASARVTSGRLSITTDHRACKETVDGEGAAIPRCRLEPIVPTADLLELAEEISARVGDAGDPEVLHAAGLLELVWAGTNGQALDRAISYLDAAARRSAEPARPLADLAAAYLARAEQQRNVEDLLHALDAASRAVHADPNDETARFNLALAAERLALQPTALAEWRNYLERSGPGGWSSEVRARLDAMAREEVESPELPATATDSLARGFARAHPRAARLAGWDRVLGLWGAAVLSDDSNESSRLLGLAEALGAGLADNGGDRSLLDAVAAIRRVADDPSATRGLAGAHEAYSAGRQAYLATDFSTAEELFLRALEGHGSEPLRGWATVFFAGTAPPSRRAEARAGLEGMLAAADASRHPALVGQGEWAMAILLLRDGRYEQALELTRSAASRFAGVGDRESVAGLRYLEADVHFAAGSRFHGYAAAFAALRAFRTVAPTALLHNVLYLTAQAAAADGLFGAAIPIQNAAVRVSETIGDPVFEANARLVRAQFHSAAGDTVAAMADLSRGTGLLDRIPEGTSRTWLRNERRLTFASLVARSKPGDAIASIDSVLATPGGPGSQLRMLQSYVIRADAFSASGEVRAAMESLDSATLLLDSQRSHLSRNPLRISLLDTAQGVFDRLMMYYLAGGDTLQAFRVLERGRASFAPAHATPQASEPALSAPEGVTGLEYALVADTLLVFVMRGPEVHLVRTHLDGAALVAKIDRARSLLETGGAHSVIDDALTSLYGDLINPVRPLLGEAGTPLVIVADGDIAGAPLAALRDPESGRYLVEDHPLRYLGSLRNLGAPRAESPPLQRALLVADGGDGDESGPRSPALPSADIEIRAIARIHPGSRMVSSRGLDADQLREELRSAEIFHFAGHAVFDDRVPERSSLLLGPPGPGDDSRLTAEELEQMDLAGLRIIVLSACETLRARSGRSGGFAGFAGAALRAGAGGVVGSTWRVDDRATAELMREFHAAYARSGNADSALRTAQLALLQSTHPTYRSPAAWAGFRYAGH